MPSYGRSRVLTGSGLDSIVAQQGRRSIIKSVQRGTISLVGAASNTATVTAVDTNNSTLIFLGNQTDEAGGFNSARCCRIALTNSTTITANVGNGTGTQIAGYELIEFYPGVIKKVQRGTTDTGSIGTVTAVDVTKASLRFLGSTDPGNNVNSTDCPKVRLNNSTSVWAESSGVAGVTCSWELVEYY